MKQDPDRLTYSLNRREVMIKGIAGTLAVAGFWSRTGTVFAAVPGVTNGETPGLTEGPYWVDGQPERVDVRTDGATGTLQAGLPLYLGITLSQLGDAAPYTLTPLVGAKVDTWCANAQGVYSDIASEGTSAVNYLRGYQVSDQHGRVEFLTVVPGWYSGRTPHIHIRVRTYDSSGNQAYNFTTQFFFDDKVSNAVFAANAAYARSSARDTMNSTDGIFTGASANGSPESEAGDYMLLDMADDGALAQGAFHIIIDPSDAANADSTNGALGGTGGGPPPGGGTPPGGLRANSTATSGSGQATGASTSSSKSPSKAQAIAEAKKAAKEKAAKAKAAREKAAREKAEKARAAAEKAKANSQGKHHKP